MYEIMSSVIVGPSPSGKAPGFDPGMRRFESCRPSHFFRVFNLNNNINFFPSGECKVSDSDSDMMIFSGNANPKLAQDICKHLNMPLGKAVIDKFSDSEIMVELMENVR